MRCELNRMGKSGSKMIALAKKRFKIWRQVVTVGDFLRATTLVDRDTADAVNLDVARMPLFSPSCVPLGRLLAAHLILSGGSRRFHKFFHKYPSEEHLIS